MIVKKKKNQLRIVQHLDWASARFMKIGWICYALRKRKLIRKIPIEIPIQEK